MTGTPSDAAPTGLWDHGLADFVDATASDSPTPGGGSAAMVAAATGCALVLMALKVTARRKDAPDGLDTLILAGERRLESLRDYAEADIRVFESYMAALRLPKDTEAAIEERRSALAAATEGATEVPLSAAQEALETLDLARRAADLAHVSIVSDVGAGAALVHGALTAVLYSVDVNLRGLKDETKREEYGVSRAHLQTEGDDRHEAIRRMVAERLA
ncbi:MAG: cyclodeaminase/cyclohydrolase family protein [Azospirillaceae bacterium]